MRLEFQSGPFQGPLPILSQAPRMQAGEHCSDWASKAIASVELTY